MSFFKQHKKLNFKEFNEEWARAGNFAYTIQFRNKMNAFDMEGYLIGLGFQNDLSHEYIEWYHHLRKNFILRVVPKQKRFFRTKTKRSNPAKFKNVYTEDYFYNFNFKFVIFEKTKR